MRVVDLVRRLDDERAVVETGCVQRVVLRVERLPQAERARPGPRKAEVVDRLAALALEPDRLCEAERAEHPEVERDRTLDVAAHEVEVPEPDEHQPPLLRSSATIAGTISCRSPITAQSARATIGAFWSLLITRILFAPLQPTMCWIAPLTPHAM